jgi:hypothetical protein
MASASKRTASIRNKKLSTKNPRRKAKLRSQGTTKTRAALFGDKEK